MGIIYDIEQDAFFKKGEAKGLNQERRLRINHMLNVKKMSVEAIADMLGLSLEEVTCIAQEIK